MFFDQFGLSRGDSSRTVATLSASSMAAVRYRPGSRQAHRAGSLRSRGAARRARVAGLRSSSARIMQPRRPLEEGTQQDPFAARSLGIDAPRCAGPRRPPPGRSPGAGLRAPRGSAEARPQRAVRRTRPPAGPGAARFARRPAHDLGAVVVALHDRVDDAGSRAVRSAASRLARRSGVSHRPAQRFRISQTIRPAVGPVETGREGVRLHRRRIKAVGSSPGGKRHEAQALAGLQQRQGPLGRRMARRAGRHCRRRNRDRARRRGATARRAGLGQRRAERRDRAVEPGRVQGRSRPCSLRPRSPG